MIFVWIGNQTLIKPPVYLMAMPGQETLTLPESPDTWPMAGSTDTISQSLDIRTYFYKRT